MGESGEVIPKWRAMRRPSWVKKSGPYECHSLANGYILVYPSWPQYGAVWNEEDGGGPSFAGRMALAVALEWWLNSVYTHAEVVEGETRIAQYKANCKAADERQWGKEKEDGTL